MVRILLSGGGTLGSVSPLIAIKEGFTSADYLFVGTRNGPERYFCKKQGLRYASIASAKLRRYVSILTVLDVFKFPLAILQALSIIWAYQPTLIITSGGFVSVPVAIAGKILGRKVIVHQLDITVGLANSLLKYIADVITVTFPEQLNIFPAKRTVLTGNPIRELAKKNYPEENMILILGGSLGARGLNEMVNKVIPTLTRDHRILHVLGPKNYDQRLSLKRNYQAIKFLGSDYGQYFQQARLVITRAGMSTITELAYFKKAAILIPIPNSQQVTNSEFFEQRQASVNVRQGDVTKLLLNIKQLMADDDLRAGYQKKLHACFPIDANKKYIDLVRQYVGGRFDATAVAYFVGIGGIGVSALARLFKHEGYRVIGSDLTHSEVTRALANEGIEIFYGHNRQNLPLDTKIVIYSSAVPSSNEELMEAQKRRLEIHSYNEYLGTMTQRYKTVAVAGTHGKTTTTAMIGLTLNAAIMDPTIIVGGLIPQLDYSNYRHGDSDLLVVEACEYRSHMLLLKPKIIVLTNIDADHLDYFKDINDIKNNFDKFVGQLPTDGWLLKNAEDPNLRDIHSPHMKTFGLTPAADYWASDIRTKGSQQFFEAHHHDDHLGTFSLNIPGNFNVLNSLATLAVADHLEVPIDTTRKVLGGYLGSWRRFERIGEYRGAIVYSDYAHHPTEIVSTLEAFHAFFPKRKLFVVFQPHSFDRTKKLMDTFATSFRKADKLILDEIYDVSGRDGDKSTSSKELFKRLKFPDNKWYAADHETARTLIDEHLETGDVLIIMGAGDVDIIARTLK